MTVVPRTGKNTLKLTRSCSPVKVEIMLLWLIKKLTWVLAMPNDPESEKNLMFILSVLGHRKKSLFGLLLNMTLEHVPLRMTSRLRLWVKVTTLLQTLGAFIEFIGPVGSDMTTHPV